MTYFSEQVSFRGFCLSDAYISLIVGYNEKHCKLNVLRLWLFELFRIKTFCFFPLFKNKMAVTDRNMFCSKVSLNFIQIILYCEASARSRIVDGVNTFTGILTKARKR